MDSTESTAYDLKSWRHKTTSILTTFIHIPAPFLSAFLAVHLSAPLLASVGGSSLSTSTMLLGREYYQGMPNENLLVWAPLSIHIISGVTRRLLLLSKMTPSSRTHFFMQPSLLVSSAYLSVILLPIHVLTHRINPSLDIPPISALGPAELDYEFVKYGLQTWPIRSFLLYGILVVSVLTHVVEGQAVLWRTYLAPKKPPGEKSTSLLKWRRIVAAIGSISILSGVFMIWKEPFEVLPSLVRRYNASFTSLIFYLY